MAKAARRSRTRGRPVRRSRGRPASKSSSRSTSRSRARSSKKKRGKRRSKKVGGDDSKMMIDAQTASYFGITSLIHNNINHNIETTTGPERTFSNILTNSLSGITNMLDCQEIFEPGTFNFPDGFNEQLPPDNNATVTLDGPNRIVINVIGYKGELEIREDTGNNTLNLIVSLSKNNNGEPIILGDKEFNIPITMDLPTFTQLIDFVKLNVANNKPLTDTGITKAVLPTGETLTNPENYIEYTVTPDGETEYKNKLFINKDCNSTKDQNTPLIAYSINGEDKLYKIQNLEILKEQEKMSKMTDKQIADYIEEKNPQGASNANNDF